MSRPSALAGPGQLGLALPEPAVVLPGLVARSPWRPPEELPSLRGVRRIGLDTETYDPDLRDHGPGFRRGAYPVGISIAIKDGPSYYLPTDHAGGGNLDRDLVMRWAREELGGYTGEVVGANLGYDLDGLATCWDVHLDNVSAFHDVQVAEPLLDEWRREYGLDALAKDYLNEGKDETLLMEGAARLGASTSAQAKRVIWRLPAALVGPYAEADAELPLRIFALQYDMLAEEDLLPLYEVERQLIPILVAMRRRGVRINVKKAEALRTRLVLERDGLVAKLKHLAGPRAELREPASLAPALEERGIKVPLTPKSKQPSVTKPFLEKYAADELVATLLAGRKIDTVINTFIDSQILGHNVDGRVHPTFNQLKSSDDDGTTHGTIGRFCLSGDTPVMFPGGSKPIQDVRVGDEVYCYDKNQRLTIGSVKWSGKTGLHPVLRVSFRGAYTQKPKTLLITANHPIRLSDGQYRPAGELKIGSRVMALSRGNGNKGDYPWIRIFGDTAHKAKSEHRVVFMIKHSHLPETVHHDDETRNNNSPSNLEGMTRSAHSRLHMTPEEASRRAKLGHARSGGRPVRAMNDAKTAWSKLRASPEEMKTRYERGESISRIARDMSVGKPTVRKRLAELGVDLISNNHWVCAVEALPGLHEVYDIEVEEHHNFIANEICVHNSGENPNLQFIPARDEVLAPLVRGVFEPEEGEEWQRDDASQIEYRFLADCAVGQGAEEAREAYRADPKTDFHKLCASMLGADPEDKIRRKRVKNTNFAKVYGGGIESIAATFGCSRDEAEEFVDEYDTKLPFVRETYNAAMKWADRRGFVTTILGGKQRFPFWEPIGNRDRSGKVPALKREEALARYGSRIQRAWTYTALNKKLQISAAHMLKKGIVDIARAGVLRVLGPILLTVHDENGYSVPRTREGNEAGREATRLMERAVELRVPVLVESDRGPDWGAVS